MFQRDREGEKLAERVPSEVSFFKELLNVLRRRASGARFKHTSSVHQGNDGKHLGARSYFENRKKVRQVIAEDVTSYRDRVLARLQALQRKPRCGFRRHDLDLQPLGIVIGQVLPNLPDQLRIMSA